MQGIGGRVVVWVVQQYIVSPTIKTDHHEMTNSAESGVKHQWKWLNDMFNTTYQHHYLYNYIL